MHLISKEMFLLCLKKQMSGLYSSFFKSFVVFYVIGAIVFVCDFIMFIAVCAHELKDMLWNWLLLL